MFKVFQQRREGEDDEGEVVRSGEGDFFDVLNEIQLDRFAS